MLLPIKKSFNWIYVFIIVFISNLLTLSGSLTLQNIAMNPRRIIGFAIITSIVSLIISLGYFGLRLFSATVIIADCAAIAYMYNIIMTNRSPGWTDLVSIISFIVVIGFGVIVGAIIEFAHWLITRNKNSSNKIK